jgi:hypothetical protein
MNKELNKHIKEVAFRYKIDKNKRSFPVHPCAMSNRVAVEAGKLSELADNVKYKEHHQGTIAMQSQAINVIVQCLRIIENL